MIKYFHFGRVAFADHLRNTSRISSRLLLFMIWAWLMARLWELIMASGHVDNSLPIIDLSWYIGLAELNIFISPRIFVVIEDDVRSGNVAYFLNRPMPYLWMRFAEGMGAMLANFVIYTLVGLPYLYFLYGGFPTLGGWVLFPVMGFVLVGAALHLLFQIFCGLLTFWSNDAIVVYYAYQKLFFSLGGVYIPMTLYPAFLYPDLLKFLPFASLTGNGVSLILQYSDALVIEYAALQLLWIGLAAWGLSRLYRTCLKKVEINGG